MKEKLLTLLVLFMLISEAGYSNDKFEPNDDLYHSYVNKLLLPEYKDTHYLKILSYSTLNWAHPARHEIGVSFYTEAWGSNKPINIEVKFYATQKNERCPNIECLFQTEKKPKFNHIRSRITTLKTTLKKCPQFQEVLNSVGKTTLIYDDDENSAIFPAISSSGTAIHLSANNFNFLHFDIDDPHAVVFGETLEHISEATRACFNKN